MIKSIILSYFIVQSHNLYQGKITGLIMLIQNDYSTYISVADNFHSTGTLSYREGKPFAGRMPGYTLPYLLLRFLFEREAALLLLGLLQIFLSALSVYLLGRIACDLFKNEKIFYPVFFLSAVSIQTSLFDFFTLPESFSVSALIVFLFFLYRGRSTGKPFDWFISGFFLTWAIFLRPFLGLLIALVPVVLTATEWKTCRLKKILFRCFLFLLPFTLCESAWIIRNYISIGKFIPLESDPQESYGSDGMYRTSAIAIENLVAAWGGETRWFYEGSEVWWFHFAKDGGQEGAHPFKPHVFCASFTFDSLIRLKKIFQESGKTGRLKKELDSLNLLAESTATRYRNDYIAKNPVRYYGVNFLVYFQRLVFSSPTYLLPLPAFSSMTLFQKGVKLFYTGIYFIILLSGIAGIILYFLKNKADFFWFVPVLIPIVIIYTIIFYPHANRIIAGRYFIGAYPVFLLFAGFVFEYILEKFIRKNNLPKKSFISPD
ncbi:MAG: glycosyltransferase family 39 protein [Bacteroidetes bacterium]|nr:glycosyltransferase family 39 protein [Bacteroidota bacterium]